MSPLSPQGTTDDEDGGCGRRLAPGDFRLISSRDGDESQVVNLSPTPSNDPNDPLNWSTWRKALNFALVFAVSTAVFTAIDVQSTFWQQMSVDMDLTDAQLNHAGSAQLAGLATGCIFFIPLTKKYGRRSTYVISTAVMAAASWWSAKMNTQAELYLTNLIYGLAGATNETSVQMTIADMFFVHQRGSMNALYLTSVMCGSFLVPMAAGVQAASQGWRWSYYALAISLTLLMVILVFAYEEIKHVPVLEGMAESTDVSRPPQSEEPNHFDEKTPRQATSESYHADVPALLPYRQRLRWTTPTSESLWSLFYFPLYVVFLRHILYTAFQYASGVVWLVVLASTLSIVFSAPPYNFDTAAIDYMNLGPFVGNLIGSFYAGLLSDWSIKRLASRNGGYFEPEMRLYLLLLPALAMAGGLVLFGASADRGMHWIYPSIGGALFAFGLGAIGDAAFTLVIDTYRPLTAEAFVGIAFFRNVVSIGIPFAITPWMETMGLTNMFVTAGMISFAISMLFLPMIIWGKRIRLALAPRYYRLL